jgi:hypothetical protein
VTPIFQKQISHTGCACQNPFFPKLNLFDVAAAEGKKPLIVVKEYLKLEGLLIQIGVVNNIGD